MVPARDGRILLVEDDEALRRILAGHLRRHGYDVIEVDSAESALEHLDSAPPPALVLLDINLPGGTGWDVLRSPVMRAAERPPVVVASAVTVSPRHLTEFEVEGYLPKPFPLETLLQTVERLLEAAAHDTESPHE
jgi:DNA-binding response OmpR family regulator